MLTSAITIFSKVHEIFVFKHEILDCDFLPNVFQCVRIKSQSSSLTNVKNSRETTFVRPSRFAVEKKEKRNK